MQKIENYINGELIAPASGEYLDNYEAATGEVYSLIPQSNQADLESAVSAARAAQKDWAEMPSEQRSTLLLKLADAIDDASDELARAEAIDNGKPITFAKAVDSYRSAANIRFFANAATQFASESHSMGSVGVNYTLREPYRYCGLYISVESSSLLIYLENCTGFGHRQLCDCQTFRSHADDCVPILKIMYSGRYTKRRN